MPIYPFSTGALSIMRLVSTRSTSRFTYLLKSPNRIDWAPEAMFGMSLLIVTG